MEKEREGKRRVLRLPRWGDVIGGLEVTGVTYPGVPPHSKPHRAIPTTAPLHLASQQPPGQALPNTKKRNLVAGKCRRWALNHKRQKAWQKRWNMTAKPWISTIQSRTSSISATERLLRLEARQDSNDTLFMVAERSICSEYKWGIKWKSWLN